MASQTRNVATGSVSHRQGRRRFVRRALARSKALFRHQTPGGGSSRRHCLIHAPAGSAPAVRPAAPGSQRIAEVVSDGPRGHLKKDPLGTHERHERRRPGLTEGSSTIVTI